MIFQNSPKPIKCPWGQIQDAKEFMPGVWSVGTASHGGLLLSPERMAAMPAVLKCNVYGGGNAFEEDCEWALVAAAWPQEFGAAQPNAMQYVGMTLQGETYAKAGAYWAKNFVVVEV